MKEVDLKNLPKGYTVFDAVDYLKSEEEIGYFLEAAFEEGGDDPEYISHALGIAARARGMTKIAKKTGLTRAALYKALSAQGNPEFATIMKVINALGLKLKVV
jgi:probable addiction module antidote protein